MGKKYLIIIGLFIPALAMADIYKCIVNGKTVFSGSPCAQDAEKIELKVNKPSTEDRALMEQQVDKWGKGIAKQKLIQKRDAVLREIRRNQFRLDSLNDEMESELEALRIKKRRAYHNLAGATWEQSISEEMNSITRKYQVKLDGLHRDMDRLQRQADRLAEKIRKFEEL